MGPEGVASAVVAALVARLPGKVTELRTRLAPEPEGDDPVVPLTGDQLPSVQQVVGHEPDQVGIESWPLVVVSVRGDKGWRPIEADQATTERAWVVEYAVRVTSWVRGDSYALTALAQQRIHLAVTECLLAPLTLATGVRVDDTSLASSMSDLAVTDAGRTIAGAYLDLAVFVEERLPKAAPVLVGEVADADTSILPAN